MTDTTRFKTHALASANLCKGEIGEAVLKQLHKVGLTPELVRKIAGLANLQLTVDEEKLYAPQLSSILDYVEQLSSVDTLAVEPTFSVRDLKNVMREDVASSEVELSQEEALKGALAVEGGMFKVEVGNKES
ncbi:MAG: Asp-tRNA(Asn)/Glu-tRNA(Gln) amidotransferase subunit GatC [Candidatus Blackburnbacteria bacterium]|nr:Asp-tRNA(Asn)/Glu-tRNA(Gln) amidotransferase subunit GatC [Candidatus Blackburnbacteria bacterium]